MATNVKGLRYFYQVDLMGNPIQGSNTKLKRRPIVKGKGQRWVEYIPANEAYPCCPTGGLKVTSIGKRWRYYVRLRSAGVTGAEPEPISGTLEKHKNKPTSYGWQEIVGRYQCATTAQFNATWTTKSGTELSFNMLEALGLNYGYEMADTGATIDTDASKYTLNISANGDIVITVNVPGTDYITLHYTNQSGCDVAFVLTITV